MAVNDEWDTVLKLPKTLYVLEYKQPNSSRHLKLPTDLAEVSMKIHIYIRSTILNPKNLYLLILFITQSFEAPSSWNSFQEYISFCVTGTNVEYTKLKRKKEALPWTE